MMLQVRGQRSHIPQHRRIHADQNPPSAYNGLSKNLKYVYPKSGEHASNSLPHELYIKKIQFFFVHHLHTKVSVVLEEHDY